MGRSFRCICQRVSSDEPLNRFRNLVLRVVRRILFWSLSARYKYESQYYVFSDMLNGVFLIYGCETLSLSLKRNKTDWRCMLQVTETYSDLRVVSKGTIERTA
jgi:hypothetical protein